MEAVDTEDAYGMACDGNGVFSLLSFAFMDSVGSTVCFAL